jgi:hypothetical protein
MESGSRPWRCCEPKGERVAMNFGIIKMVAALALLSLAMPVAAADQHYSDLNKPAWAYQSSDWWQVYESQVRQSSSHADQERNDGAHFRYWSEHHRQADGERDYRWRWKCDQDGDNCRPNPYSYGTSFTPPDSLYYRQYNPSYGYVMPWSFYVTPYR